MILSARVAGRREAPHAAARLIGAARTGAATLIVCACSIMPSGAIAAETSRTLPLPVLPRGPIELRVAHVVNPRLPRMDSAQLALLLDATTSTVREHFGVDVRFTPLRELPIEALFATIPADRRAVALNDVYDFKSGKGDPDVLAKAFAKAFRASREPLAELIAFTRPYVGEPRPSSYAGLGVAVSRLQLERIRRWQNVKALDGGAAIDTRHFNEYPMWVALGYADVPFEVILTNQVIASVEYSQPEVHSAVRGGYANGITTYSRSSRFQTVSIWSTFAFTTDDPWVTGMRDGETYSKTEAARLAGIAAAHEIGHQLFHFLHPFGRNACVMNPVPLFAYRAWAEKLSAKECPIGSNPAMTPGAYQFRY